MKNKSVSKQKLLKFKVFLQCIFKNPRIKEKLSNALRKRNHQNELQMVKINMVKDYSKLLI